MILFEVICITKLLSEYCGIIFKVEAQPGNRSYYLECNYLFCNHCVIDERGKYNHAGELASQTKV